MYVLWSRKGEAKPVAEQVLLNILTFHFHAVCEA